MRAWLIHRLPLLRLPSRSAELAFCISVDGPMEPGGLVMHAGTVFQVSGQILFIEANERPSAIVTNAHDGGTPCIILIDFQQEGVELAERILFDPSRPGFAATLGARVPAVARCLAVGEAATLLTRELVAIARILTAAEMVGIAARMLELAVKRARERRQFGQPIGNFQALSHMCADMLCDLELSRSLLYAVGERAAEHGAPLFADAAKAKLLAGELCPRLADQALHVFGAEGLTWDAGLHFAVRRVQVLRALWGDPLQCETDLAVEMELSAC